MKKEQLKRGDKIQSNSGQIAFVDVIFPNRVRVWSEGAKFNIFDEELENWSYANPIINNRIVSSKTFAVRFKRFLEWIPEDWINSQPHYYEEYEYMKSVANQLLKYQIQTVTDKEEIDYLTRLSYEII